MPNAFEGLHWPFADRGKWRRQGNFLQKNEGPSLPIVAERCVAVKGAEVGSHLKHRNSIESGDRNSLVQALDGTILREAPSVLPATQEAKDNEEFEAPGHEAVEGPFRAGGAPRQRTLLKGSELTSLLGPQNPMKEAECIRSREYEGQGGGLTPRATCATLSHMKGTEVPSVTPLGQAPMGREGASCASSKGNPAFRRRP